MEQFSYNIKTEVPPNYKEKLLDFIHQNYIAKESRFSNISRTSINGYSTLAFTLIDLRGKPYLNIEVIGSEPVNIKITPTDETSREQITLIKEDLVISIELFEEKLRKNTLYFAWREGEKIVPEKIQGKEKNMSRRLFLETQILLMSAFLVLSMVIFAIFGWLMPIILLAIQFIFVFYSNRIIAMSGDWRITEKNPKIHFLEYHLSIDEHKEFMKKFTGEKLLDLKKDIYEKTVAEKGEIDCASVHDVFAKYEIECNPEDLSTKTIDVHQLVKKTADKFGFPMPEIVISNTILPNAAASGLSPNRGVVLITTGLLTQLENNEIISVLGHEFGHLKGHDPLILFGLTAVEFLLRFYVFFYMFPDIFLSYLFIIYFWAVMTIIYFIAKFFEARADLVSAMVIGEPQVLAEALEKIGFRRLMLERAQLNRIQEWISLEPHPPIYFRVNRLEKLKVPVEIKHPLIQSAKEVTKGFLTSAGF